MYHLFSSRWREVMVEVKILEPKRPHVLLPLMHRLCAEQYKSRVRLLDLTVGHCQVGAGHTVSIWESLATPLPSHSPLLHINGTSTLFCNHTSSGRLKIHPKSSSKAIVLQRTPPNIIFFEMLRLFNDFWVPKCI